MFDIFLVIVSWCLGVPATRAGAVDGTRIRDLALTKGVLYQLSYNGKLDPTNTKTPPQYQSNYSI